MSKAKKKPASKNKKSAKPSKSTKFGQIKSWIGRHKLLTFALLLLVLFIQEPISNKYRDWDNAQLIQGLARDFPLIVDEINQETGAGIEQKVDCSITQEKFGDGKRTCEFKISLGSEYLDESLEAVDNSEYLGERTDYQTRNGYGFSYRNKDSCTVGSTDYFSLSCIIAINDANIDLAREVILNQ